METEEDPTTLHELLNRMGNAMTASEHVSIEDMLKAVGRRSFGPLLLVAGLIALSPLSGIPGMPTTTAVLVLCISLQLIFRRTYFWLPRWILRRKISRARFAGALRWLRGPARWMDRLLRPRLPVFVQNVGFSIILVLCIAIALIMPVMEIVPFAATAAGAALTGFGLALIARDGLIALLALTLTLAGCWAVLARFI